MKKLFFLFGLLIVLTGCSSTGRNGEGDAVCKCSGNIYNCDDFSTHREAQKCYDYCGGVDNDVHELDRDLDGSACETL